jgi:hypothetical protein
MTSLSGSIALTTLLLVIGVGIVVAIRFLNRKR